MELKNSFRKIGFVKMADGPSADFWYLHWIGQKDAGLCPEADVAERLASFDKGQLWSKFLHFDRMIAKTLDERCRKAAIRLCEPTRGGRCL